MSDALHCCLLHADAWDVPLYQTGCGESKVLNIGLLPQQELSLLKKKNKKKT